MSQEPQQPTKNTIPGSPSQESSQKSNSTRKTHKISQNHEEIRTLFVSGLPPDVREREIHNLFRFFFGYEGCILNDKAKPPVAFVSFTEREFAVIALRYLHDVRMDLTLPQKLRIEFAKSNSKTKRLSPQDLFASDRRGVISSPFYPPYQYGTPNYPINTVPSFLPNPWFPRQKIPSSAPSKRPCSTLFVANIHHEVPERDIFQLFASMKGFRRLKMSQKDGSPICFVEFSDSSTSTQAMNQFQGFNLGANPIRIEYAKSKMKEENKTTSAPRPPRKEDGTPYEISGSGDVVGENEGQVSY